jgi:RNA polymerase sigma factor (sigma-70 family)
MPDMNRNEPDSSEKRTLDPSAPWHVSHEGVFLCTDQDGFTELQEQHWDAVVKCAGHLVRNGCLGPMDAEDLASEASLILWRKVSREGIQLKKADGFPGYLCLLTKRQFYKMAKRQKRHPKPMDFDEVETEDPTPFERPGRNHLLQKQFFEFFDKCFKDRPDLKYILERHSIYGEKLCDIARRMGLKEPTVRKKFERGRERMRKRMDSLGVHSELRQKLMETYPSLLRHGDKKDILSISYSIVKYRHIDRLPSFSKSQAIEVGCTRSKLETESLHDGKPAYRGSVREKTADRKNMPDDVLDRFFFLLREYLDSHAGMKDAA